MSLARGGTWRRKRERLKAGESNGNLPLRNCLECSVPEPYRSPDWALVPAKTFGLNTNDDDDGWGLESYFVGEGSVAYCCKCSDENLDSTKVKNFYLANRTSEIGCFSLELRYLM